MADNLIKRMGFIPDATPEDIQSEAVIHASELIKMLQKIRGMNADTVLQLLATAVRIGVLSDGQISQAETDLIRSVFQEISDCTEQELNQTISMIDHPLDNRSFKIVEDLFRMNNALGMEFINLIICFSYVDGQISDEVSEKLSEIVRNNMKIVEGDPVF